MYYYLHGYGSSSNSIKANIIKDIVGVDRFYAPDFSSDNIELVKEQINAVIAKINRSEDGHKITIVGSSLGGLYALYISCFTNVKVILLNPCLAPHLLKKDLDVDVDHVLEATNLSLCGYKNYDPKRVRVWVTSDDEVINHQCLTAPFFYIDPLEYREFNKSEACLHAFEGFREIFKGFVDNS